MLATVFLTSISTAAYASTPPIIQSPPRMLSECQTQAPYGFPQTSRTNTTAECRLAYALLHDNQAKVSAWEVYTLTPVHAIGCLARVNAFASDQSLLKGQRAELVDYAKSGYDTGHIANDADMSWDAAVQKESFILSNMAPQLPSLNRGIWKELETAIRSWTVNTGHNLTIYAGSIYDIATDKTVGPDNVVVPHAFYKIIIDDTIRVSLAFIFPHTNGLGRDVSTMQSTVANVESATGITFPVPDSKTVRNQLWSINLAPMTAAKKLCNH